MRLTTVLLAALLLVVIVAAYFVVATEQAAPSTTSSHDVADYQGQSVFSYEATIRPDTLYPNGTVLQPGEGPLFSALMTNVNLSFTYTVSVSAGASVLVSGGYEVILSGGGVWNYTLNESFPRVLHPLQPGEASLSGTVEVNVSEVKGVFASVQNETGFVPSSENVTFEPVVFASVVNGVQTASAVPKPSLTFTIESGQWVPSSSPGAISGGITSTSTSPVSSVVQNQHWAIAVLLALLVALGVVGYFEIRAAQRARREIDIAHQLRQFTTPYKDAIADTATPPRNENVVSMYDWEDLVHVADMLGKPILQFRYRRPDDTRHFFYVLDGSVQYVYLVPVDGRSEEGKTPYDVPPP